LSPAYPTTMERRNSKTLVNVAYNEALLWDGRAGVLEKQALVPIQNPLLMNQNLELLIEKLNAVPSYVEWFQQVFGTSVTPRGHGQSLGGVRADAGHPQCALRPTYDRGLAGDV